MKLQQPFEFTYNLKRKVVRDLKIVTEYLPLTVIGFYYCDNRFSKVDVDNRYDMDLEEVIYKGMDIKEVLDFAGVIEDIEEDIIRYAPNYFTKENAA